MNLQTFQSPQEPKESSNRKPLIIGLIVAVLVVAVVIAGLIVYQHKSVDDGGEEVYVPQYDEDGNVDTGIDNDYYDVDGNIRVPDEVVTVPEPEIDYEPAPVDIIYNPEADTNDDGHITKDEWQDWVDAHPEDLDQDLVITEAELAEFNGDEPPEETEPIDEDSIGSLDLDELNDWFNDESLSGTGGPAENFDHEFAPIDAQ